MRRIWIGLLMTAFLVSAAAAEDRIHPWEHLTSDLPANPRIHFGALDNGLRFAWMSNPEPDKRLYLRLYVHVGSLDEQDDQQGMAHFLEHMAFNGSKDYPAGTLIEWFQSHGMSFGADTNATTGFESTIYNIDLPTAGAQPLSEGLSVLRDVIDGLLLEEKEIESEKGVVDAEERERDSAGFRTFIKQLRILYDGTRLPERIPIGIKSVRDKFTSQSVRAFYERWYRPDNMTLVLVGDLEDLDPEALIRQSLAGAVRPASPLPPKADLGDPTFEHRSFSIQEKEIPTAQISVEQLSRWVEEPDNRATRVRDLALSIARAMLNLRFDELAKKEGATFLNAGVGSAEGLETVEGEILSVVAAPDKWKPALGSAEQELRRALKYGFQAPEFEEVRARWYRSLDESVQREKTRSSSSFVSQLLGAAGGRVVPANAETSREVIRPALEKMTVEDCHKAFRQAWDKGIPVVGIVGDFDLGETPDQTLMAALDESRKVGVQAPAAIRTSDFAYASSPDKAGKIAERKHVDDLDFDQIRFENGVLLSVKKTDFKEKQILIEARLGEGLLSLPPDRAYLSIIANTAFTAAGLEAHSAEDLRRLTAGKQVGANFSVGEDAFVFSGSTTKEDLLLEFELMTAYMTHPGWRVDGLRLFKAIVPRLFEGLKHQHFGPVQQKFIPRLHHNDPRFVFPEESVLESASLDEIKQWLTPVLADGPLEIVISGDLDVEATIQAAARTFGVLAKRRDPLKYAERRKIEPLATGIEADYQVETQVPKTLVFLAYPTTDGFQAQRRRTMSFLSEVLNDRLRVAIREKLGASYSPNAGSQPSDVFPGIGMMVIQSMAEPKEAATLRTACIEVADKLASEGTTQEEVDRLRKPLLAGLRDALRTNSLWLRLMEGSQTDPQVLEDARALVPFYESIKPEQINAFASKYLKADRVSSAVIAPKGEAGSRQ